MSAGATGPGISPSVYRTIIRFSQINTTDKIFDVQVCYPQP